MLPCVVLTCSVTVVLGNTVVTVFYDKSDTCNVAAVKITDLKEKSEWYIQCGYFQKTVIPRVVAARLQLYSIA